jgi:hypothetical protein
MTANTEVANAPDPELDGQRIWQLIIGLVRNGIRDGGRE